MALVFPKTDLIQPLTIRDGFIREKWRQEQSTTSAGQVIVKDMGPMLWGAYYRTMPMFLHHALDFETELLTLHGGLNLFTGYDPRRPFPQSDNVSLLEGVTVHAIQADRAAVQLVGLPASFEVSKSDYLSIDDGTNLHLLRVASGAVASAGGVSEWIEVRPFVRSGINVGDPVTLRYPSANFMLDKNSISVDQFGPSRSAVSFSAIQVIL